MKRALAGAALVACLVLAPQAGAADLPASQSQITSGQLVDENLIWFQRNDRVRHRKHGGRLITPGAGAIYARPLANKNAARIYVPPKGSAIVGFNASAGRVIVGLASSDFDPHGASSAVELVRSGASWSARPIAEQPADPSGCGRKVRLTGIAPSGEVVIQRVVLEGRGENCLLTREQARLISLPQAGGEVELGARTSGWASSSDTPLLAELTPLNGAEMLQVFPGESGDFVGAVWRPASGQYSRVSNILSGNEIVQPLDATHIFLRNWRVSAGVVDIGKHPAALTDLGGGDSYISWFRPCGSRLLEIRRSAYGSNPRSKWILKLRDISGNPLKTLTAKLVRGTTFDACNRNTAVFHRPRKGGGIRQWAVNLPE